MWIFIFILKILSNSILEPLIFTGQIHEAIQKIEDVESESDYIYLYFLERLKWMETGNMNNLTIYNSIEIEYTKKEKASGEKIRNNTAKKGTAEEKQSNTNKYITPQDEGNKPNIGTDKNEGHSQSKQDPSNTDSTATQSIELNVPNNDNRTIPHNDSDESSSEESDDGALSLDSIEKMKPIFYLLASEGHSPFFEHIFCHNAFFSFLSSDRDIYSLYLKICMRIVKKYTQNRFFFHDKIKFSNILQFPQPDYLMHLIRAGDRKAEETLINMFLNGPVDPQENIDILHYLVEEKKNSKAMTILGNLHLINKVEEEKEEPDSESSEEGNLHESINKKKNTSINENTENGSQQTKNKNTGDTTSAMHYFRSAIVHGDYFAYNGLGRIFMMKSHLEHSLAKGYFEEASLRGSAEGDFNLYLFFKKLYEIEDLHHLLRAVKKSYMPALFVYAQRLYRQGDINQAIAHLLPISEYDGPIIVLQNQTFIDYKNNDLRACLYKLLFLSEMGSLNAINNLIYLLKRGKIKSINYYFTGNNLLNYNRGQKKLRINKNESHKDFKKYTDHETNEQDENHRASHQNVFERKIHPQETDQKDKYDSSNSNDSTKDLGPLENRILFYLLSKSVHMGQTKHLVSLADCYQYGEGVKCDPNASFSFYYSAYLYGDAKGAFSMYKCYLNGIGTERSFVQCLFYLLETRRMESNAYILVWYMLIYTVIIFILRFNISLIRSIGSAIWMVIRQYFEQIGLLHKILFTFFVGLFTLYFLSKLLNRKLPNQ